MRVACLRSWHFSRHGKVAEKGLELKLVSYVEAENKAPMVFTDFFIFSQANSTRISMGRTII